MRCPKCSTENPPDAARCGACGGSLAIAVLEVVRGFLTDRVRFLRPRDYSLGRASHNDIALNEPSISKLHARIEYRDGRFYVRDAGSLHGVYVNACRVQHAELLPGAPLQVGNVTLKYSPLSSAAATAAVRQLPWVEQQQQLLALVQTLNSTLVLGQVFEQVLDGVIDLARAERGFLLLAEDDGEAALQPSVAGLRLRAARPRRAAEAAAEVSAAVVRRVLETGELVVSRADPAARTGPVRLAAASAAAPAGPGAGPAPSPAQSVACFPLRSPRSSAPGAPSALGVVYVDKAASAEAFGAEALRAAQALAGHAALAIDNAQLFEREQRTIEELQRTQAQLLQSEKLATIGRMAVGIAHELNTPLTYVMGNLELLELQPLDHAQREMLASVARGAERIRALAQRLLAFSRPAPEEMTPLVVNELVERSLELCRYQLAGGRVQVERRLASGLPQVLGVSNQLETALINLVVNAVQAMGEAGGRLTVTTSESGGRVEIAVADEGPGIPETIRGSVFEPFVTTKPEGKGSGLGLSTVLTVVERHAGRVWFESEEGRGTTFRVALPPAGRARISADLRATR